MFLLRFVLIFVLLVLPALANKLAPFFDPTMPVYATPVNAGESGMIARGLLLQVGAGSWVVFDQELLRPALWFETPVGVDPLTLETMAQASWYKPTNKAKYAIPKPQGKVFHLAPNLPGIGNYTNDLLSDPRIVLECSPKTGP